jgi:hypothetical protein
VRALPAAQDVPVASPPRDVLITTRYADGALHVTVLPPDGAAAALARSAPMTAAQLSALGRVDAFAAPAETLTDALGQALARSLLGPDGTAVVGRLADRRLVIQHDVASAALPFETLVIDRHRFALNKGVVRRPALEDVRLPTPRPGRAGGMNVALVINPTEDLPGAELEGNGVLAEAPHAGFRIRGLLRHGDATKAAILALLGDPDVDVFHFSGHGFYRGPTPRDSGLVCAGAELLTGDDLAGLAVTPRVAFFNACRSARVRDAALAPAAAAAMPPPPTFTRAFAACFLRGGIEAYLGTLWPVLDEASAEFAVAVYRALAGGAAIDAAVLAARGQLHAARRADWANYILYGDGTFAVAR